MFPFDPPENMRKPNVFWCFQCDQKVILGSKGLMMKFLRKLVSSPVIIKKFWVSNWANQSTILLQNLNVKIFSCNFSASSYNLREWNRIKIPSIRTICHQYYIFQANRVLFCDQVWEIFKRIVKFVLWYLLY